MVMMNNGEPYFLRADVAKAGQSTVSISNYLKMRVNDNGKILPVKWYDQNRVMNINGMIPFIEGAVGQFTTDPDTKEIIMASDAVHRDWQGSTANTRDGGWADYILTDQMFTQEGIFYGKIGLMNAQGTRLTSINVWFRVLGDDLFVSETTKYYSNLLEEAKRNFEVQTSQVIDDARNSYTKETKEAHDSLDALRSQIQANRDEQANLSNRLAGTKQQIQINDVVTRPEFNNLSTQLTQQVGQLKEAGLEFFSNYDELVAKYPQGANKLCVTLNDSHEWIYDYAIGQWNDAGAFNYGKIDPNLLTGIYKSGTNLVPNPNFDSLDGWRTYAANDSAANYGIRQGTKFEDSNIYRVVGYWDNEHVDRCWTWTESEKFNIDSQKTLSYGAMIFFNSLIPTTGGAAQIQLKFFDENGKNTGADYWYVNPRKTGDMQYALRQNINPAGATKAQFVFGIQGGGYIDIAQPQVFEGERQAYSLRKITSALERTSNDLLAMQPVTDWQVNNNNESQVSVDDLTLYNGNLTRKISNDNGQDVNYYLINTLPIAVKANKYYKITVPAKVQLDNSATYSSAYLTVNYFDKDGSKVDGKDHFLLASTDMVERSFILHVPENVASLQVIASIQGKAILNLSNISLVMWNETKSKLEFDSSSFTCVFLDQSKRLSLANKSINITSSDPSTWAVAQSDFLPVPTNATRLSVKALAQASNGTGGQVNVSINEYADEDAKTQIKTTDLKLKNANSEVLNEFSNVPLDPKTKYIAVIVGTANGEIAFSNFSIEYNSAEDYLVGQQPIYDPLKFNPFYTWFYSDSSIAVNDKQLFGGHSTVTIAPTDKSMASWIAINSPKMVRNVIEKLNLNITYKAKSTNGAPYLVIRQYKDNQLLHSDNILLEDSSDWTTKQIRDYPLQDDADAFIFLISVNGTASITVGDFDLVPENAETKSEPELPQFKIDALSTQISESWNTAPFAWKDGDRTLKGYVQFGIQGNSSAVYPKKNMKLKFFTDKECKNKLKWQPKAGWTKNNKFNVKANWIDATQSRNLVNAKIFEKATANTPIANQDVANHLLNTQSLGQMEGFPIEITMNDGYYGLFTFNTKKDDKVFGMDSDNPDHEVITNENSELGFNLNQGFDEKNYGTNIHDAPSDSLKANFTAFENFINNSADDDFKAKIGNYIDVKSVINIYLYGLLSCEWDFQNKSQLLLTWNGGKYFFMVPYDLDSTWNLYWDGSHLNTDSEASNFALTKDATYVTMAGKNLLMNRIFDLMKDDIKAQYVKLRSTVWRNDQIIDAFKQFINAVPQTAYDREQKRWPNLPSRKLTDFAQIQSVIIERGNAMDQLMDSLS